MREKVRSVFSADFWEEFSQETWDAEPRVFKNVCDPAFVTENELFQSVCAARQLRLAQSKKARIRFYRGDQRMAFKDYQKYLPELKDGSFDQYRQRLANEFAIEKWGMIFNELNGYVPSMWEKTRELLWHLFAKIGMPGGQSTVDSLIGTYEKTPFGLHKDARHVITFPVIGEKVIHLWPFEPMATLLKMPNLNMNDGVEANVGDHIPGNLQPIELRASPGDMIYWPQSYWHIAQGGQGINATVTIGLQSSQLIMDWASHYALVPQDRIENTDLKIKKHEPSSLKQMKFVQSVLKSYAKKLSSHELSNQLTNDYYSKLSAYSFSKVPEFTEEIELSLKTVLSLDTRFPVLMRKDKNKLHVFYNGHGMTIQRIKTVENLIKYLNRGGPFLIEEIHQKCREWAAEEKITFKKNLLFDLLTKFIRARALTHTN